MVAVALGATKAIQRGHFGAAYQHVWSSRGGIEIDELAPIEIRKMLAVRRPGELIGRVADQAAMRKYLFHGERLHRALSKGERNGERQGGKNRKEQRRLLASKEIPADGSGLGLRVQRTRARILERIV